MNYVIILTEEERQQLAAAFSLIVHKLSVAAPVIDEKSGTDHARAMLAPPSSHTTPSQGPAVGAPSHPTPTEVRDRWARDRKGNELPNPEGCMRQEVRITKMENRKGQNGPFVKATWEASNSRGFADGSCFDKQLISWLTLAASKAKQDGTLVVIYTVRNDKYLNIVGVKA